MNKFRSAFKSFPHLSLFAFSFYFVSSVGLAQPCEALADTALAIRMVEELSQDRYEGRKSGQKGTELSRQYIREVWRNIGLEPWDELNSKSFDQEFFFIEIPHEDFPDKSIKGKEDSVKGINLVSHIKGTEFPDKFIVVTAHYDHLGIIESEIYNGADDNASGVGALASIGEHFSNCPPLLSILLVAFDAEENDLDGAWHFVENLPVKKEQIAFNLNLDMISRSLKNELWVCGTKNWPFLAEELNLLNKTEAAVNLQFGHERGRKTGADWTAASDHYPFFKTGIPFLYFGVEDHEDYHKHTDDFDQIDRLFYGNVVNLISKFLQVADQKFSAID